MRHLNATIAINAWRRLLTEGQRPILNAYNPMANAARLILCLIMSLAQINAKGEQIAEHLRPKVRSFDVFINCNEKIFTTGPKRIDPHNPPRDRSLIKREFLSEGKEIKRVIKYR